MSIQSILQRFAALTTGSVPDDARVQASIEAIEHDLKDIKHHMGKPEAVRPHADVSVLFNSIAVIAKVMVRRLDERSKTARSKLTEEQIADRLFKAADALFTARGAMRAESDILQDAYDDATGLVTQNMYADPEVKKTRDALYELDHHIGDVCRQMEHLARVLKKLPHRGS